MVRPDGHSFAVELLDWIRAIADEPKLAGLPMRIAAALTRYLNAETREAWPSHELLARRLGAGSEGVRKAVDRLEEHGFIVIRRAKGKGGNRYKMARPSRSNTQPELGLNEIGNPNTGSPEYPTAVGLNTQRQLGRTNERELTKGTRRASLSPRGGFDAFWEAYPRKEGIGAARRQFEIALAKSGVTVEVILASVVRYAAWAEEKALQEETQQYTLTPVRWLADEHWEDELPDLDLGRGFPTRDWYEKRDAERRRAPFASMVVPLIEDDDS